MAELQVVKGAMAGHHFPINGDAIVIGRHHHCDVVLEVGAVSREHARILRTPRGYFVEDLHSRNGTFINNNPVEQRAPLGDGDQLRICDTVFLFRATEAGLPAESTRVILEESAARLDPNVTSRVQLSFDGTIEPMQRRRAEPAVRIKALLNIGRSLGSTLRLNEVLRKFLDNLFVIFPQADRGFVILTDARTGGLEPRAMKHRRPEAEETIRVSRTIVQSVMREKEAILSADAANDSRFDAAESVINFQIHSMMCAPLVNSEGESVGVIQIDATDHRQRFDEDDLDLLASVASQAAVAIENAQLHEIALQEKAIERELEVARQVQQGFLPKEPPRIEHYEFFDSYEPAKFLGGDYFDYVPLAGGRLAIVLGDVSGKGVSASLLMAKLSAETRYNLVTQPDPVSAVAALNLVFSESRWEDRFVTLMLVVLDPATHRMTFVNAGHCPPLVRSPDGCVRELKPKAGLPLGVDGDACYVAEEHGLAPGEVLMLYSDGFPDAMNANDEWYGDERLQKSLSRANADDVQELGRMLLRDVRQYVGRHPQFDDRCVTLVRRCD